MLKQEKWSDLFNALIQPMVELGLETLWSLQEERKDSNAAIIPYCALLHLADCLKTSIMTNLEGRHTIAICLLRQAVETLTLVDIGLQNEEFSNPLLNGWNEGKKNHGDLRKSLEENIWPRYGKGLWDETWSEFFANLARAVQPYAHYTQRLLLWQYHAVETPPYNSFSADKDGIVFNAQIGPSIAGQD